MITSIQQIDVAWLVLCAATIFIGQVGIACIETASTQHKARLNVVRRAFVNGFLVVLLFWLFGFGLLHWGLTPAELTANQDAISNNLFALNLGQSSGPLASLFLFQAMLASFMAMVVTAFLPERMNVPSYLTIVVLVSVVVYPVTAHWSWSGALASGWLSQLGFIDFAGSSFVHSAAGWSALAWVLVVGTNSVHSYRAHGEQNYLGNKPIVYVGLLCLLVAWFGINAGPLFTFSEAVPAIMANVLIAVAAACAVTIIVSVLPPFTTLKNPLTPLKASLAGLVASSASCHAVSTVDSIIIGVVAAVVAMTLNRLLIIKRVSDPLGILSIFIGAGVWGTLAVALFIEPVTLAAATRVHQFGVQLLGVVAVAGWSFGTVFLSLKVLDLFYSVSIYGGSEYIGPSERNGLGELIQAPQKFLANEAQASQEKTLSDIGQTAQRYNRVLDSIDDSVRRAQAIVRDMHSGLVTFGEDGTITSINPSAESIFKVTAAVAVGRSINSLFANERKIRDDKTNRLLGLIELNSTVETFGVRAGSGPFRMEVSVTQSEVDGKRQYVALIKDIQDKRQVENQLFKEQKRAVVTLGSIADGVITTDENGKVTYLNSAAERQTGWNAAQARNYPFEQVFTSSQDQDRIALQLSNVLAGSSLNDDFNQTTLVGRSGSEQPISYTLAPIKDQFGDIFGCVAVFHDVTSTQALQRKLSYQATHDDLTGVLNRNGFESKAQQLLNRSVNYKEQHVLGFMDLDQFKVVNDTCGHQAGDELLRQIAQLIKKQLRSDDTLARMGGDEFCMLLQNCNEHNGLHIAEIIRDAIAAYRFSWQGKQFSIGASIGLVKMTHETPSLPKLIGLADSACYAAKDQGRNRVNLYQPNDLELAERRGQIEWISKIRRALDHNSLRLYFQPIETLQVGRGEPQHIEVFVHLLGENGKLVPPGAFIPAAERYSVIQEVDMWVVRNALSWLGDYQSATGNLSMLCSINLSGTTIGDKQCLEDIIEIIDASQVSTSGICFEITETAAIGNFEAAKRFIVALKEKGCSFSLDDFGSGLSSFGYLKNLPVDYLKIDGVFIKDILNNRVDRVMVDSITKLAHELGLKTVAEFVSSQEIAEQLRELGVDYAQGYFLAKPQPLRTLLPTSQQAT